MPTHTIKNTDSHLVLKVIREASHTISLSDGEKNDIVPVGYYINGLQWSQISTGNITLERNSEVVYDLYGSGSFNFYGKSDDQLKEEDIVVKSNNNYTLLIELKKIV